VPIIRNNIRIIPVMAATAADIPLCTEIIMAKGRIIMIMVEPISHIIANMTNTMSRIAGTMIIQSIINTTEATIILLTMKTETTAATITLTIETIVSDSPINKH
jgi:hypothetical protein